MKIELEFNIIDENKVSRIKTWVRLFIATILHGEDETVISAKIDGEDLEDPFKHAL